MLEPYTECFKKWLWSYMFEFANTEVPLRDQNRSSKLQPFSNEFQIIETDRYFRVLTITPCLIDKHFDLCANT